MRIFTDKQTGVRFDRKAFLAAIEYLNEGDTLVGGNWTDLDDH